jgi:protein-tyrosine phosphatase
MSKITATKKKRDVLDFDPLNDISLMFKGVYLSNFQTSLNLDILKSHNIKTILTLSLNHKPEHVLEEYKKNHITFDQKFIDDRPSVDISEYFEWSFNFIEDGLKKGNVLVHCDAGISRSASIVAAYIGKKYNIFNLKDILILMDNERLVSPNDGFQQQLKKYLIGLNTKHNPVEIKSGNVGLCLKD